MLKYFLPLVLAALILGACQNEQEDNTAGDAAAEAQTAAQTSEGEKPGAYQEQVISEQTQRVVKALTNNYWVMEVYVKINDREAARINRGRWYNFQSDGTYTSGQWQKQTGQGTWKYNQADGTIHIDADKDLEDSEFSIKISNDGMVMIWVGTKRYGQNSIQTKLGNYMELPASLPTPQRNPG